VKGFKVRVVAVLAGAGLFWLPGAAQAAGYAYCGVDHASGLGVLAAGSVSCRAALQVAAAYTAGRRAEVHAAGARWACRERPGTPDPYQACVDVRNSARVVALVS